MAQQKEVGILTDVLVTLLITKIDNNINQWRHMSAYMCLSRSAATISKDGIAVA